MLNGSSLGPFLRENQPKYMWQSLVKEHKLSIVPNKINHEHPILKWLEFWKNEPQMRKEKFPIYKERGKKRDLLTCCLWEQFSYFQMDGGFEKYDHCQSLCVRIFPILKWQEENETFKLANSPLYLVKT